MKKAFYKALHFLGNGNVSRTLKKYFMKRSRYYTYKLSGSLTQQSIVSTLRDLELSTGDVVCVHSSFSSLGYVEGGPETLIRALEEVVGPSGTIMMPTFSMVAVCCPTLSLERYLMLGRLPRKLELSPRCFGNGPAYYAASFPPTRLQPKAAWQRIFWMGIISRPSLLGRKPRLVASLHWGEILMINTHIHSFLHHVQDLVDFQNLYLDGTRKAKIIDETGAESTIETQVMRVRVPYYLILPGTDGFQEDYALIFDESRGPALLQAGF